MRRSAAWRRPVTTAPVAKKGPPAFGGPSLGRNALRSKAPLEPVRYIQWQEIVSGRLRSNRKMAAGRFLRNRPGEVSSRDREAVFAGSCRRTCLAPLRQTMRPCCCEHTDVPLVEVEWIGLEGL